jgi:predicted nucleotidyltransferase
MYGVRRNPASITVSLPNEPESAVAGHLAALRLRLEIVSPPQMDQVDLVVLDPRDHHSIIIEFKAPAGEAQQRDAIVRTLRAEEPELRKRGILALRLFGSAATLKAHPNDVDLLARFDPNRRFSAFDIGDIQSYLEQRLGKRVDLSNERTLPAAFKDSVDRTGIVIFDS